MAFGNEYAVWLPPLLTVLKRWDQLLPQVLRLQFGGAAGTLARVP